MAASSDEDELVKFTVSKEGVATVTIESPALTFAHIKRLNEILDEVTIRQGKDIKVLFLGKEISTQKNYSETIAFQIDEEIAYRFLLRWSG